MCKRLEVNSSQRELMHHRTAGLSSCHSSTNTSDTRLDGTAQSTTPVVVRKRAPPATPFTVTLKRIASADDCNVDCSVAGGEPDENTTVWLHTALLNRHAPRSINRDIRLLIRHIEHSLRSACRLSRRSPDIFVPQDHSPIKSIKECLAHRRNLAFCWRG